MIDSTTSYIWTLIYKYHYKSCNPKYLHFTQYTIVKISLREIYWFTVSFIQSQYSTLQIHFHILWKILTLYLLPLVILTKKINQYLKVKYCKEISDLWCPIPLDCTAWPMIHGPSMDRHDRPCQWYPINTVTDSSSRL